MCGIYGITKNDIEFVKRYMHLCSHRGPDGSGVFANERITLGHNLLSITDDPKNSQQPWYTAKGNILVYNGEIFNYKELVKHYKNFQPRTNCDTELLAWGLDECGLDFIDKMDSMHGFAYYNQKEQRLILSRDHAGIKPLYYAEVQGGLVFGSEVKGLLEKVPNSNIVDPMAMSCMSLTGINATRNTFYKGVKKVMAGETLIYDLYNKKFRGIHRSLIRNNSNKKLDLEEFRYEAKKVVEMCTLGIRKIGVFLSGGLDSSLVAHELKQVTGEANTFTNRMEPNVITDEDHNSDANAAKILAKLEEYNHKEVLCTPDIVIKYWEDSLRSIEQPMYNPSLAMYYYTNKVLSDDKIVVTMAGDMGDELLGGYTKYWSFRKGKWGKPNSFGDLVKIWMKRIKHPVKLLDNAISENEIYEELLKLYPESIWNPLDPVNSYMMLDCLTQVPEEFFRRNDKFGMAFSMEGRFPLATKRFMQYCMNFHSDHKIGKDKGDTKLPIKKAYANILPDNIIKKEKTGWTTPVSNWMINDKHKGLNQLYKKWTKQNTLQNIDVGKQRNAKSMIPAWQMATWAKIYSMTN